MRTAGLRGATGDAEAAARKAPRPAATPFVDGQAGILDAPTLPPGVARGP